MTSSAPGRGTTPGWYPDPHDSSRIHYWDGQGWSGHSVPVPDGSRGARPSRGVRWWQTWWVVVPGLLFCLPLGLIGLWRRQGLALWLRIGVTLATVALFGVAVTADETVPPQETASVATEEPSTRVSPQAADPSPETDEPQVAVVPRVMGLSQRRAVAALTAAGLRVRERRGVPSARPRGTVLRQGTRDGASVPAGSAIDLVVAAPYPRVPAVVARSQATARSLLRDAGFKVRITVETRTSGRDGVVLRQTPSGRGRAKPYSTVTIVVSSVVRPVAPPPVESCTPGYTPCLTPASDYDCAGGSGDGPGYAAGPVYISGYDPYDLDRDGDGVACES